MKIQDQGQFKPSYASQQSIPTENEEGKSTEISAAQDQENFSNQEKTGLEEKPPMVTPKIIALFEQHSSGELSTEEFQSKMDELRDQIKPVGNIINTSS